MPLTDQQLRQELLSFGETVPPITQRNREQLRARLDYLRSRKRSPAKSPTSRTRSRPARRLIELSDSETDTSAIEHPASRPVSNITVDVEQSIARHRREIQQLIDSARDRARAANSSISSGRHESPKATPIRPTTTTTLKPALKRVSPPPSRLSRSRKNIELFWTTNKHGIFNLCTALLIGFLIAGGLILLKTQLPKLIPQQKGITCTPDDALECDEMIPIINAVRKYLQVRTGEVECGIRQKTELRVSKAEINKYLDGKGFKFESSSEERWTTLITYIIGKPINDILLWNIQNQPVNEISNVYKLSSTNGIHPMLCRVRKTLHSAMQHLAWLLTGTAAFLTLGWLIRRRFRQRQELENKYKDFLEKIISLLENQYQEHLNDSEVKPWLAIVHIRDMLIPSQDRERYKSLWERAKKHISTHESRIRAESQLIHGEEFEVWRWIQPHSPTSPTPPRAKRAESAHSPNEESYVYMPPDVGLTQCLKLRNFFDPHVVADDDEIDLVVDSIQNRCATVKRIEHIGIHAVFVYLKFSSKEAAAQGFHLLNNWKYHGREIIAKYLRLERYHEHFPEARDSSATNN